MDMWTSSKTWNHSKTQSVAGPFCLTLNQAYGARPDPAPICARAGCFTVLTAGSTTGKFCSVACKRIQDEVSSGGVVVMAQQNGGEAEVVLKDAAGQNLGLNAPNGQLMTIHGEDGDSFKVRYNDREGFCKKHNVLPVACWEMLESGQKRATGKYTFDDKTRVVMVDGLPVGTFIDDPISTKAWNPAQLQQKEGRAPKCVKVVASEIMKEIQKPENNHAFFVLPSQLNGAEYPSERSIVKDIDAYKSDRTGGPRGQLAAHPAAGQFILDNAANDNNRDGIDATDIWLPEAKKMMKSDAAREWPIRLDNGYLTIPALGPAKFDDVVAGLSGALHNMRCLGMREVLAQGLDPTHAGPSQARHRVTLFYASAIPINAYQNTTSDRELVALQTEIGRLNLIGQYYGALKLASDSAAKFKKKAKIFLMPLGGGVFRNPLDTIVGALSSAIELLHEEGVDLSRSLDINMLAWEGNPSEATGLTAELEKVNKFAGSS